MKGKNLIVVLVDGETARFDKATIDIKDFGVEIISTGGKHYIFTWNCVKKFVYEDDNGSGSSPARNIWGYK